MKLAVIMSVYNEEDLLGACLESIKRAGFEPGDVHIFDGAWRGGKNGSHVFANGNGPSTDATVDIALDFGATVHLCDEPWPSQEAKRTAMFNDVEATHYLVMDADEELLGEKPDSLPDAPCNVMIKCIGENDMPGIRGVWPHGDYCPDYKPELRLFVAGGQLECVYPGGYWYDGEIIEAYADAAGTSALHVLESLRIDHHGNARTDARKAQKRAYYEVEHPERQRWQAAIHKTA